MRNALAQGFESPQVHVNEIEWSEVEEELIIMFGDSGKGISLNIEELFNERGWIIHEPH